jgi:hypothetical protein
MSFKSLEGHLQLVSNFYLNNREIEIGFWNYHYQKGSKKGGFVEGLKVAL